jgi:TonB-dependent SusC/RagA subfamily outer membrane receptor
MKINKMKVILTGLFCFVLFFAQAQTRMVQGLVTTFDSIVVIGAEVKVKSSKLVYKTDTLGHFTAEVTGKDKVKVSAMGFITNNIKLDEKTKFLAVNLKLKSGEKAREYAIGYGYVKDVEKLNAVSQMTSKDMDFSQYTSMHELIRGRFAGVQVQSNGDIVIRGVNSLNLSSAALIVVDGVPTDQSVLNTLVPANVKSINIIKDGSSAIYGSRGANGVVVIETKKGGE